MRTIKLAVFFGFMTMIFNAILFTLYDKLIDNYINEKILALTSLLGFISGMLTYFSIVTTGALTWI